MKVICFSTKDFERPYLERSNAGKHTITFANEALSESTAEMAKDHDAVLIFTGDDGSQAVLERLNEHGIRFISLRSAGYDNVSLEAAHRLKIKVAYVPAYSPHAIAEHAVSLMLALNRKLVITHDRVQLHNFSLNGLVGFDMVGKTAGIIGTGRIGSITARILDGFGCRLLAYDLNRDKDLENNYDLEYTSLDELISRSDIISIHLPLNAATRHLIGKEQVARMKHGVMLINTARGAVIDTAAVTEGLRSGTIGSFGMDVYEFEKGLFFYDHSEEVLQDDLLARLMSFNNVLITPHQAFLTREALSNISDTTIFNLDCWEQGTASGNEL